LEPLLNGFSACVIIRSLFVQISLWVALVEATHCAATQRGLPLARVLGIFFWQAEPIVQTNRSWLLLRMLLRALLLEQNDLIANTLLYLIVHCAVVHIIQTIVLAESLVLLT